MRVSVTPRRAFGYPDFPESCHLPSSLVWVASMGRSDPGIRHRPACPRASVLFVARSSAKASRAHAVISDLIGTRHVMGISYCMCALRAHVPPRRALARGVARGPREAEEAVMQTGRPLPMHLGVKLAQGYVTYADEIHTLHRSLRKHCSTPAKQPAAVAKKNGNKADSGGAGGNRTGKLPNCPSCTLEMELTYMRLRQTRPRVVWEISPMHGFSTLMILLALEKNNNSARLHSFDRHEHVRRYLTPAAYPSLLPMWRFHLGDVGELVAQALHSQEKRGDLFKLAPRPSYVFLDSWHSEDVYTARSLKHRAVASLPSAHKRVAIADRVSRYRWASSTPRRSCRGCSAGTRMSRCTMSTTLSFGPTRRRRVT